MPPVSGQFALGFGIRFEDLYNRDGLVRLDAAFLDHLASAAPHLQKQLITARTTLTPLAAKDQSDLIIAIAPHLEDFIGELFGIATELVALQARHHQSAPFFAFKRKFIQKRAISGVTREQAEIIDRPALARELESVFGEPLTGRSFVTHVSRWLDHETDHAAEIQTELRYAAWD